MYDALLIGIGAVSVKMSLIFLGSASVAFCLACSFYNRISSSVSSVKSGRKKSCSSSATSVDCRLICIGLIVMSSRSFNSIRSLGFRLILDRKSAAVFVSLLRALCGN